MLPAWFIIPAIAARLLGGVHYAKAVWTNQAQPNPVSWFFWALTSLIVFVAQLCEHVGWTAAVTFSLGISPLIIFILSLKNNLNKSHFTLSTIICGICAAIGIIFWLSCKDPLIAIFFCIFADFFSAIPTIIKAWQNPASEFLPAYALSMLSTGITLLIITQWTVANSLFPAYMFSINFIIFSAGYFPNYQKAYRMVTNKLLDL
jgi:hypothetical protein